MPKFRYLWFTLLIAILMVPHLVGAQPEEVSDVVTQALNNFANLQNYHFTSESTVSTEFADQNGTVSANTNVYSSEGSAAKTGDNQTTIFVSTANGDGALNPPLKTERIIADGTLYVNFHLEDTPYEDMLDVEPGWWRYDDLRARIDDKATALSLDNFVKLPLPAQMPALDADYITSVSESAPETMDGRSMRVFDVELDALNLLFAQSTFTSTGLDRIAEMVNAAGLAKSGEVSASLRLWIGTDDAQIYRAEGDSETYLPYRTTGNDDMFPYDLRTSASFSFTLSEYDEPVEISAPSPVHEP